MKSRLPQNSHVNLGSFCGGDAGGGADGGGEHVTIGSVHAIKLHIS